MANLVIGAAGAVLPVNTTNPFNGITVSGGGNLYVSRSPGVNAVNAEKIVGPNGSFSYPAGISPYTLYFGTDPGINVTLSYSTDGSTLSTGIQTAQLASNPQVIYTNDTVQPAIATGSAFQGRVNEIDGIDVAGYASVIIEITCNTAAVMYDPGNYLTLQVVQYDSPNDPATEAAFAVITKGRVVENCAQWILDATQAYNNPGALPNYKEMTFQVPVKRSTMDIIELLTHLAGVTEIVQETLGITVYGSSEQIPDVQYTSHTYAQGGTITKNGAWSITTTANIVDYIASQNGDAVGAFTVEAAANASTMEVDYLEDGIAYPLAIFENSGGASQIFTLKFPSRPIRITIVKGAGVTAVGSISQ
jgi:hypothetical protein